MTSQRTRPRRCFSSIGDASDRVVHGGRSWGSVSLIARSLLVAWLAVPTAVTVGCARPRGPVFERPPFELVWPAPPAEARIRYIGMLKSTADLKGGRSGMEVLTRVFIGKKEPEPLYGPRSLVVTPDGERVWIADTGGRCLHGFDLRNREYVKVQRAGETPLLSPVAVSLGPAGSIYVCDSALVAIHRFDDRTGRMLESLRLPEELLRPTDVHFDEASKALFVVDVEGHDIKVLELDGSLRRIIGRRGSDPGEFNFPTGITADGDRLWVADTGNHRVQAVTRDGKPILGFGQAGDAPGDLALPKGIAVDSTGNVYVVDARFENVQVFDRAGRLLLFFGEEGTGHAEFWLPADVFIEPDGRIWVCDVYNRRVQVFQLLGVSSNEERTQRDQS